MDKWTTTKSESLVDNHWVKIRKDSVVLPNEQKIDDFYVITINNAAAIVAIDEDGNCILKKEYGYCLNTLHSYTFEGSAGFEKMQNIMVSFRKSITEFAGKKVLKCLDYSEGIDGLPKSDVLKFFLEDNCSIVVRPSGTEPKLKAYISVSATTKEEAQVVEGKLARAVEEKM